MEKYPVYSFQAFANQKKIKLKISIQSCSHWTLWENPQDTLWFTVRRGIISRVLCNTLSQVRASYGAHLFQELDVNMMSFILKCDGACTNKKQWH